MYLDEPESWHLESKAHIVASVAAIDALGPQHYHHIFTVRRLKVDDYVTISDGAGAVMLARVGANEVANQEKRRKGARHPELIPVASRSISEVPDANLEMVLSLIDLDKLGEALTKLTELGVGLITLVKARRSASVGDRGDLSRINIERVDRILREAAGQCRSLILPKVRFQTMPEVLPRVTVCERGAPVMVKRPQALLIGPEGGFDSDEIPDCQPRVSLPGNTLRAETAAVTAAAIALSLPW